MNAAPSTIFSQLNAMAESGARRAPATFAMPAHTISEMERHGIGADLIDRLFGPRSKIVKLLKTNENLDEERTDKALRLLRIVSLAEKVFESPVKAMMWLRREHTALGAAPIDLLARETGATLVEETLLRMEYGVSA